MVPGEKVVTEIAAIFNRMTKTYCAISKLEHLLEAVRLTYENVSSSLSLFLPPSLPPSLTHSIIAVLYVCRFVIQRIPRRS